ncbi:MAG TPA: hypothetical protein DEB09_04615 [Candidatus Magasanikbacteria bacterium]|nr:hypothetical protein [Candidatus Magasanikbacteria bacterium]
MKKIFLLVFLLGILFVPGMVKAKDVCSCFSTETNQIIVLEEVGEEDCNAVIIGGADSDLKDCSMGSAPEQVITNDAEFGYSSYACPNIPGYFAPNNCITEAQRKKYCGCMLNSVSTLDAEGLVASMFPESEVGSTADSVLDCTLSSCNAVPCCFVRVGDKTTAEAGITEKDCEGLVDSSGNGSTHYTFVASADECKVDLYSVRAEFQIPVDEIKELNKLGSTEVNDLFARLIKLAMGFVGSVALLMFIYGGLLWMTAAGSAEKEKKSFEILLWSGLGVVVILSSYALADFVLKAF